MAAEPTETTTNPQAPEGSAPAATSGSQATPAIGAGEDAAALKAQLDALLKHKAALEADLKKHRDAKKEAEDRATTERKAVEDKLREQGEHVKLREIAEEKVRALEAQLADLSPKAERLTAHEQRVKEKLEAAKAAGDLPSYIVRAIDAAAARDVDEAADILAEFRASQAAAQPAPKQPAPPAPALGGAPASPAQPKKLAQLTPDEIQRLPDAELNQLLGKANGASHIPTWRERFFAPK